MTKTFTRIEKRLYSGKYKSHSYFNSAVARAKLSNGEDKKLLKLGKAVFLQEELATTTVRKKRRSKGKGYSAHHHVAQTPWAVAFHRVVSDAETKRVVIDFLRSALDAEQTLPDLVDSLGLVD
jgi:hypothetical protein